MLLLLMVALYTMSLVMHLLSVMDMLPCSCSYSYLTSDMWLTLRGCCVHETQQPRRNRQRNVIWFNPPRCVETIYGS